MPENGFLFPEREAEIFFNFHNPMSINDHEYKYKITQYHYKIAIEQIFFVKLPTYTFAYGVYMRNIFLIFDVLITTLRTIRPTTFIRRMVIGEAYMKFRTEIFIKPARVYSSRSTVHIYGYLVKFLFRTAQVLIDLLPLSPRFHNLNLYFLFFYQKFLQSHFW